MAIALEASIFILGPPESSTQTSSSERISCSNLVSLSLSLLQALWIIFASCGAHTDWHRDEPHCCGSKAESKVGSGCGPEEILCLLKSSGPGSSQLPRGSTV